jgi:hypothetical protein
MHAVLLSVHPSQSLDPDSDLELLGRDLLGLLGSGRLGLDSLDLGLLVLGADLDGGLGLGPDPERQRGISRRGLGRRRAKSTRRGQGIRRKG